MTAGEYSQECGGSGPSTGSASGDSSGRPANAKEPLYPYGEHFEPR